MTDVERTRVRVSSDTLKHVAIIDDLVTIGTDVTFIDVGHCSTRRVFAGSERQRFAFSRLG